MPRGGDDERIDGRRRAASLFNRTWELLDLEDRTPDQDEEMVHTTHASRYFWGLVGQPINFARGDWQIARVYAVLGRGDPAMHYARRYLEACESEDFGSFDLAFAHEGMARSLVASGDFATATEQLGLAVQVGAKIPEEDERAWLIKNVDEVRGLIDGS